MNKIIKFQFNKPITSLKEGQLFQDCILLPFFNPLITVNFELASVNNIYPGMSILCKLHLAFKSFQLVQVNHKDQIDIVSVM